jgi:phosphate transport system substrate-binding protein
MKRIVNIRLWLVIVAIGSLHSIAWSQTTQKPQEPPPLIAAGSGVNLGITRLLAEAFTKGHPQIKITVPGSIGTRGAIKATAESAISIGLISRPLEKEELTMGFTARRYARVPIVLAAHPNVKDEGITSQELIEIYKGTKTQWKDGNQIIVQAREKSDSGFLILQDKIPGFKEVYRESHEAKRWTLFYTDQEANQAIEKTPYAISVSDLGMIKTEQLKIKVLKINGIAPTPENLLNGSYPLERELIFIYLEKSLPKELKGFLAFVSSDAGRKILKSHGYLPVN